MRTVLRVRGNVSVAGIEPLAAVVSDAGLLPSAKQWVSASEVTISMLGDRVSEMEDLAFLYLNPHGLVYTVSKIE